MKRASRILGAMVLAAAAALGIAAGAKPFIPPPLVVRAVFDPSARCRRPPTTR